MSKKDKEEEECLKNPDGLNLPNWRLPFLAYGFFKPGQLAFSQISEFTKKNITLYDIEGELKHVNGMPVLVRDDNKGDRPVKAYLLKFKKDKDKKDAYNVICNSKDMHIYKWKEIKIKNNRVNVLVSADPEKMDKIFNAPDIPDSLRYWYDYDWRKDPVYRNALLFIESRMDRVESKISLYKDYEPFSRDLSLLFVEIQSLYMTLWSAIDRFLTFRYGGGQKSNLIKLADEEFFKESLKEHVETNYTVTSAQNLKQITLDPEKELCSAFYYYTLRNNVVHSGKMNTNEVIMLYDALVELIHIFNDVWVAVDKECEDIANEFNYVL